jgi:hypothetical protein
LTILDRGPIAVGGVGGSGTRVVASVLQAAGVYIGPDLNQALDNRWFSLLFRRPEWYRRQHARHGRGVKHALDLFSDSMAGQASWTPRTSALLGRAVMERRSDWSRRRRRRIARRMVGNPGPREAVAGWGWKEPNTHVYLPELLDRFEDLTYIHVIRHGLDMAMSRNQNQVAMWSWYLDPTSPSFSQPARRSLRYWYVANKRAIDVGELLGDRFLLLNFDEMCQEPVPSIHRLLEVARVPHDERSDWLAALVEVPASTGRYSGLDLRQFTDEELDGVRELGFDVTA